MVTVGLLEVESLKSTLVHNNGRVEWCTIAVFVGLIVEYTILLWLKRKDFSRTEIILTLVAGLAIAGGVYGEYHFGSIASAAAVKLEGIAEDRVATLNQESVDLQKQVEADKVTVSRFQRDIANAKKDASEADARAADARSMAAAEQLERIKLEARVAPRSLDPDQQRMITAALRKFSGHPVTLLSYGLDGEGAALGAQIISVLTAAGFAVTDSRASFISSGGFELGIHVRGPNSEKELILGLGNALASIGKLQVCINCASFRAGATMSGGATLSGRATMSGGGGVVPAEIPAAGPVSIMIGIKPVPVVFANPNK
jgi:hypothetical protein